MRYFLLTIPALLALCACNAGPQHRSAEDSVRKTALPGVRRLPPDSPAPSLMPVVRPDTTRQAEMPVAVPPKNIQPK